MSGIDSYSTTPATNAAATGGAVNWAEGQPPSTVNNSARQNMADTRGAFNDLIWFNYGTGEQGASDLAVPSVYASSTSFTITGADVTLIYTAGRRVRAVGTGTGTIYGTISSSSYNGGNTTTTVNVVWDSGSLSNETIVVSLSQIPVTGGPVAFPFGTFTPAITFGGAAVGVTYSAQTGTWTRVGGLILFRAQITLTSKGSSTGNLAVTSLPFTASASSPVTLFVDFLSGTSGGIQGSVNGSATTISLYQQATGTSSILTNTNIQDTSQFIITGTYPV